ncbi:MAG TPA: hypothetical protein VGE08_03430 [Steroidobacter sp.]
MGAVDYVFKPVDPVILRSKVAVLVDLYRKNVEVERKAALERFLQEENLRIRQEKIEAERQLRQIEERQTAIVRSLPIALYSSEVDAGFSWPRFINDVIAGLIGFAPNEFCVTRSFGWTASIATIASACSVMLPPSRCSAACRWSIAGCARTARIAGSWIARC